jgi:GDP-mannose 6-dehydrogenase
LNVAVFGLGYVGSVTSACLARDGHHVIGVDVNRKKIAALREGKSPIIEPGMTELVADNVNAGRLEATDDAYRAVQQSELLIICVGTPSHDNGSLDLQYVCNVFNQIGAALADKDSFSTVVLRSTVLPGASLEHLLPALEAASGKQAGIDFGFCVNPEFLREGSAINDFDNPPFTVIGEFDERSGEQPAGLYANINAPLFRVPLGVGEMVKYASNAFHALKVTFANEIGNLCQAYGVDSHMVMDIFTRDTKLNLSPAYLLPGFAFGGSCLPKDLRAMLYAARQADIRSPVLESILPSNQLQTEKAVEMLVRTGRRRIGMLGLSFKPNTDDLRESPALELAERLLGKGFELFIYDREVSLASLHGSNRAFMEQAIPHIHSLLQPSLAETIAQAEAIVVTKPSSVSEYQELMTLLRPDHILIDLVRLNGQGPLPFTGSYHGIAW